MTNLDIPLAVYKWGWAVFAAYFVVLEGLAILDTKNPQGTLSWSIRWLRDQYPYALYIIIGGTITWLFIHFLFQDNVFRGKTWS